MLALPDDRRRYSSLVAAQLHRIVDSVQAGDRRVRDAVRALDAVLIGGGRLPAELADRADAAGIRVRRTYGASETAGGCVYDGVPLAGVEVRIADGEVQLSGPTLAEGYLGDAARTAAAFLDEPGRRWYRTGDAGEWDGTRLSIVGRLDDVIITGGEKVSLGLVERAVQALPGLGSALVVRATDPEWGDVPVVVSTTGADLASVRDAVGASLLQGIRRQRGQRTGPGAAGEAEGGHRRRMDHRQRLTQRPAVRLPARHRRWRDQPVAARSPRPRNSRETGHRRGP